MAMHTWETMVSYRKPYSEGNLEKKPVPICSSS